MKQGIQDHFCKKKKKSCQISIKQFIICRNFNKQFSNIDSCGDFPVAAGARLPIHLEELNQPARPA
jgi:hypothetical protein